MRDKTIGILTYQRANNHGALLQAFATQQIIRELGWNCELIDYRDIGTRAYYKRKAKTGKTGVKSWLKYLLRVIYFGRIIKRQEIIFRDFQRINLVYSDSFLSSRQELIDYSHEVSYQKIVVGSDQVWNTDLSDMDMSYFLDFIEDINKKVAFAASFGRSRLDKMNKSIVLDAINSFQHISVREKQGADMLLSEANIVASICLDPTLILVRDFWNSKVVRPKRDRPYALCFVIGDFSEFTNGACRLISEYRSLPIVMVNNFGIINRFDKKYDPVDNLSPFELLGYIKDADLILTTSFHGTAFAINLEKEFYSLPTNLSDEGSERNSRIVNILDSLDLSDRYALSLDYLQSELRIQKFIDYQSVRIKLKQERDRSLQFIKNALKT
jgi:hypothetical protein